MIGNKNGSLKRALIMRNLWKDEGSWFILEMAPKPKDTQEIAAMRWQFWVGKLRYGGTKESSEQIWEWLKKMESGNGRVLGKAFRCTPQCKAANYKSDCPQEQEVGGTWFPGDRQLDGGTNTQESWWNPHTPNMRIWYHQCSNPGTQPSPPLLGLCLASQIVQQDFKPKEKNKPRINHQYLRKATHWKRQVKSINYQN